MKMERNKAGRRALSLNEVLIVLTLIGVVGSVILPMLTRTKCGKPSILSCVSQLKSIGLAFRILANDNNDLYPMQVAEAAGGAKEAVDVASCSASFSCCQTSCPCRGPSSARRTSEQPPPTGPR